MLSLDITKYDWRDAYSSIKQRLAMKQDEVIKKLAADSECLVAFPYESGIVQVDLAQVRNAAEDPNSDLAVAATFIDNSEERVINIDADELADAWADYNTLLSYQQHALTVISSASTAADAVNGITSLIGAAVASGNSESVAMLQNLISAISDMDIDVLQANAASLIPLICGEFSFSDETENNVDLTAFINKGSYSRSALLAFVETVKLQFPDVPALLASAAHALYGVFAWGAQKVTNKVVKFVNKAWRLFGSAEVFSGMDSRQGRFNTTFDANSCCLVYGINMIGGTWFGHEGSELVNSTLKVTGDLDLDAWSQVYRLYVPGAAIDWAVHRISNSVYHLVLSFRPLASTAAPSHSGLGGVSDDEMRNLLSEFQGFYQLPDYLDGADNSNDGRMVRAFGNGQRLFECWYANYSNVNVPEVWGVPSLNADGQTVSNGISPYPYGVGQTVETPASYTSRFADNIAKAPAGAYEKTTTSVPGCTAYQCYRVNQGVPSTYRADQVILSAWIHGLIDGAGLNVAIGSNSIATYHINTTADLADEFQSFATGILITTAVIATTAIAIKLRGALKVAQIQAIARYNALAFAPDLSVEDATLALKAYRKATALGRLVGGLGTLSLNAPALLPKQNIDGWSAPQKAIFKSITGELPS